MQRHHRSKISLLSFPPLENPRSALHRPLNVDLTSNNPLQERQLRKGYRLFCRLSQHRHPLVNGSQSVSEVPRPQGLLLEDSHLLVPVSRLNSKKPLYQRLNHYTLYLCYGVLLFLLLLTILNDTIFSLKKGIYHWWCEGLL